MRSVSEGGVGMEIPVPAADEVASLGLSTGWVVPLQSACDG